MSVRERIGIITIFFIIGAFLGFVIHTAVGDIHDISDDKHIQTLWFYALVGGLLAGFLAFILSGAEGEESDGFIPLPKRPMKAPHQPPPRDIEPPESWPTSTTCPTCGQPTGRRHP